MSVIVERKIWTWTCFSDLAAGSIQFPWTFRLARVAVRGIPSRVEWGRFKKSVRHPNGLQLSLQNRQVWPFPISIHNQGNTIGLKRKSLLTNHEWLLFSFKVQKFEMQPESKRWSCKPGNLFLLNGGSLSLMLGISMMVIRSVNGVLCISSINIYFGSRDGGSINLRLHHPEFILTLNGINCKEWKKIQYFHQFLLSPFRGKDILIIYMH